MSTSSIRITCPGLESDGKRKILRGVIEWDGISALQVADYQREAMPFSSLKSIFQAYVDTDNLPDIELGMRGHRYVVRDNVFYLQDPVFIIDGLQRTTAARLFREKYPGKPIRLGVKVYFDTTKEWEREQFIILNTRRVRVSADKIIYNRHETSKAVGDLYSLSEDKSFALRGKVSWRQRKGSAFIGAFALAKIVCALHVHKINGLSSQHDAVVQHLDRIRKEVGDQIFRDNIRTFFEVVDACWGVRHIQHYEKAPQIKFGFLYVLARFLSEHGEFWRSDDKRLFVDVPLRDALKKFKIYEPTHANLCSSTGRALDQLRDYLVIAVNKGKRGKRLVPRSGRYVSLEALDEPEGEATAQPAAAE